MKFFNIKQNGRQNGVSLIEMLLVVAIIVILSAITVPIQSRVLTRQYLSDGADNIVMALRSANLQAKLASNGLGAGVYFETNAEGEPSVIFYRGPSFKERNIELDLPVEVSAGLSITVTPDPDVNFEILSSKNEHDTIIKIENNGGARQFRINTAGAILEEQVIEEDPAE